MLSFRERSQVTIPGLRRSRNEISFASPRGAARVSGRERISSACTAASSSHRLEPVASSLFQFSLRFEKSSGRCATREFTGRISSWDDIIPYLPVLSRPTSLSLALSRFSDSLLLAGGKPLVKDFFATLSFRLRSRNFISFRRLSRS